MKIETLEDFVNVAKRRNITRAAVEMHTSQPALSSKIALLEKEVGCELLSRSNTGIELTESGRVFLEYAQKVVSLYREGVEQSRRVKNKTQVRVVLEPEPKMLALMRSIDDIPFSITSPDIGVFVPDAVARGEVDVAMNVDYTIIEEFREEARLQGLTYLQCGEAPSFIAMMSKHPLASMSSLKRTDLTGASIVVNSGAYFDHYSRIVQHMIGDDCPARFKMRNAASMADVALEDFGDDVYICGAESTRRVLIERPDVVVFEELDGHPFKMPYAVICRTRDFEANGCPAGEFARKFVRLLRG